jgi:hypothetical protein
MDSIAEEEPELAHDLPNLFLSQGVPFEFDALLNYLFVIASEPVNEAKDQIVFLRGRNAVERVAALRALAGQHRVTGVGEINGH